LRPTAEPEGAGSSGADPGQVMIHALRRGDGIVVEAVQDRKVEVRDADVAIDVNGQLPMGLLGLTFLRHFKVSVDRQQRQIRFER
jgi:hypothetical protein